MIPILSIPVLNRYDLLDKNLSLVNFPIKEILIINNGKEIYEPKRKDLNIRVLNLPSNLGMSGSWNLTIKLYPHEKFWLFSSADTHWLPDSLEKFYELSGESKMVTSSESYSCFSVGENIVREIGLFDEYFYPYLFEDSDYGERLAIAKQTNDQLDFNHKAVAVSVPYGTAQTVKSDPKLAERGIVTHEKNKAYWELKKSQNFKIMGQWDIDVRRSNEWLQ
jgi:GT2 family glycosyltransferase